MTKLKQGKVSPNCWLATGCQADLLSAITSLDPAMKLVLWPVLMSATTSSNTTQCHETGVSACPDEVPNATINIQPTT